MALSMLSLRITVGHKATVPTKQIIVSESRPNEFQQYDKLNFRKVDKHVEILLSNFEKG